MKRHSSLVPLSHDHHHALVRARQLRQAADGDAAERQAGAALFLGFFTDEIVRHFREEEEHLFPLLVDSGDRAGELLVQALVEHQQLHALVAQLDRGLTFDNADAALMRKLADLLQSHTRLEERHLFPLIEEVAPEALTQFDLAAVRAAGTGPVVDLLRPRGRGPLWGTDTDDLNATLLGWGAGDGPPEHVNDERDVLVVILAGSAIVTIDGAQHPVQAGGLVVIEKGRSRRIAAGTDGVRYLSVHRRRAPLQIATSRPTVEG